MGEQRGISRRAFGASLASAVVGLGAAPAFVRRDEARPAVEQGAAVGDVSGRSAVVWSRTDRPSRMVVEWSTTESFQDVRHVRGPAALPESDHTAQSVLTGLPPGQTIHYRVTFRDLSSPKVRSVPVAGSFRTPSAEARDVSFAWSGDTAGQGWGIDRARGGMRTYEAIRTLQPDFFLHSGDNIYADNPILPEVPLDDGTTWVNVTTEATSKAAETLEEFRGRYLYNLLDDNVRRMQAEVPLVVQWDDHEVTNNWYPGELLEDPRYTVKSVDLLAARARRAFGEYVPLRAHPDESERVYRSIRYGPLLEVFVLDARTYRGPNTANRQAERGRDASYLGRAQRRWLERRLIASNATWKVIAHDMPIGLTVPDGPVDFEAAANGDGGAPLGRELELAALLSRLKAAGVRNVVWLTADVHYAASHRYDPGRAAFVDFLPFREFVAGPLHAGGFGPNALDGTFGPAVEFASVAPGARPNRHPSADSQTFGTARIDGASGVLTVTLRDGEGRPLHEVELPPEGRA